MPPSMSMLMASVNPCPNPHIPPIRFEFCDVLATSSVQDSQEHTIQAERALRAYWAQAANMTKIDQQEYIRLLKKGSFAVPKDAIADPSKHSLYNELSINPSWPKYVMLKAMYDQDTFNQRLLGKLEDNLKLVFGSLDIKDLTSIYHHAGLAKRKREQESESDDDQDIPSRIVKMQPPENSSAEKNTATTTRAQRPQYGTQRVVAPKSRGINIEEALKNQNALLKRRCDALESSVADLQRKIDSSHLNLVVLLTTILEKVGQVAEDIDAIRGEFEWGS
ncbi:hypothetical protein TRIATDRAFT_303404 [Trichoderma atroviride IMI 206040]|uniref:Uncharacterized protein n=2 Tax=Hypocrea atroviridis TaxID=63577 RepID=G9NEL9_HYPAI|nr:uncharacterized protein TRIATDRAFT_303404 [Trichoderma atroviride IMI 206040]EHK50915.1 hypothetical protein TRIATDRAFT_303404 [Trichoderma atroviride IMI 206040]